ncbi:TIR-like protein FxsC, partial [Streptomyces sp. NPDC051907]|uniref:TIR-like protein FxsC n=1 Tax=Streptomyces sp. NPDC051907 TaxID=3155284 RepID=UPI00343BDCDE
LDRRMGIGAEWERQLKQALATCQVFVPVYTKRYFSREWCGKEWDAFARRQAEQHRTKPYTVNAIVPVLWLSPAHLELPPVAEAVQYTHPDLGEPYLKMGLYGLRKSGYPLQYRRAVWGIAQTIVKVAQQARLEPCDIGLFDDLRNVFEGGT